MKTATLVLLLAVVGGSFGQDYCKICSNHTMCIYKKDPGPRCQYLFSSGIGAGARARTIVDYHNECRRRIVTRMRAQGSNVTQPPKMYWDRELARVAQRWANQCTPGHDACRNVERFRYVGQNIVVTQMPFKKPVWLSAHYSNWRRALTGCGELRSSRQSPSAWAYTTRVGCAYSQFQEYGSDLLTDMYVCNYGPGGVDTFSPNAEDKPRVACSQCHGVV